MKKTISSVLCLVMAFSLLAGAAFADYGFHNFKKTSTYKQDQFTDVSADSWYAKSVSAAYELNLMNGQSESAFGSDANVKLSEAIAMAARLNSIYNTGKAEFSKTEPWYQSYVDYADKNNIVSKGRFTDLEQPATRFQFAEIFAAALSYECFTEKNAIKVGDIPDVSLDTPYEHIYKLYRAGIITGKTEQGHFYPNDKISRAEVAAIVTRMADESLRVAFTIKKDEGTVTEGNVELKKQIALAKDSAVSAVYSLNLAQAKFAAAMGVPQELLFAVSMLTNANELAAGATKAAKDAMALCKDKTGMSSIYSELETAYLAGVDATERMKLLGAGSGSDAWLTVSSLLQGCGSAAARAEEALSKLK